MAALAKVRCVSEEDFETPTHVMKKGGEYLIPPDQAAKFAEAGKVEILETPLRAQKDLDLERRIAALEGGDKKKSTAKA